MLLLYYCNIFLSLLFYIIWNIKYITITINITIFLFTIFMSANKFYMNQGFRLFLKEKIYTQRESQIMMNKENKEFMIMSMYIRKWCKKKHVSRMYAGNKTSHWSIRSFKDCMPDINLVWILVIDNRGLNQQKDFLDR